MKEKDLKILAIETSCDETAAAVIGVANNNSQPTTHNQQLGADDSPLILSNIVSSQIDLHAITGGVVPEVASRAHMEQIIPVITEALLEQKAKSKRLKDEKDALSVKPSALSYDEAIHLLQNEVTHIAVTCGPGLIGSLLVGFNAAKAMAYALDIPIIPINHIEGHIYSALQSKYQVSSIKYQDEEKIKFPVLALTVSGGHTSLTLMKDHGEYVNIGQTLDDAAGEAFDKVAKLLGLGYPGGPAVSKLAQEYRSQKWTTNKTNHEMSESLSGSYSSLSVPGRKAVVFPRPIMNDGTFNFSFSGLKTAVLVKVKELQKANYFSCHPEAKPKDLNNMGFFADAQNDIKLSDTQKQEICAAFEDAAVDVLVTKTIRAAEKYKPKAIILAGGVAANEHLRNKLENDIRHTTYDIQFLPAPKNLTGDNAVMIGLAAYYHIKKGNVSSWDKIKVDSNLKL